MHSVKRLLQNALQRQGLKLSKGANAPVACLRQPATAGAGIGLSRLLLALLMVAFLSPATAAAEGPIEAKVTSIENKFPDELVFTVQVESNVADIRSIVLRSVVGSGPAERYGDLEFTPGRKVEAQLTFKTGGNHFVAAGADITHWLEVEDQAGNKRETPREVFWYADTRFQWENVKAGPVTVFYYGGAEGNAQAVLEAADQTRQKVGRMFGAEARPFRVMLYNSPQDIVGAQREELSEVRRREILRAGVAYSGEDLVQVLGFRGALGTADTARHEITHLYVHWAAGGNVPAWLNEGLAVWAQTDPGGEYRRALSRAIERDALLLLRGMARFPGRSDESILAYGQAYSVVSYLIDTQGPDKLRRLLESIKAGEGVVRGLESIYGLTLDKLDAEWRKSVGAPPRSYESVLPTPIPVPVIPSIGAVSPPPQPQPSGSAADAPADAPADATDTPRAAGISPLVAVAGGILVVLLALVAGAAVFTLVRRRD